MRKRKSIDSNKPLVLIRTSLRELTASEVAGVVGGTTGNTCRCLKN